MAVSNYSYTEHTQNVLPPYFCSNLSFLVFLSFSLCLSVADPAPWFPGSARLSCQSAAAYISVLLPSQGRIIPPANHRSAPSIHPIHLSVKQLHTAPLSPLLRSKQPPSTEALRSSFNSHTSTQKPTHQQCAIDMEVQVHTHSLTHSHLHNTIQ